MEEQATDLGAGHDEAMDYDVYGSYDTAEEGYEREVEYQQEQMQDVSLPPDDELLFLSSRYERWWLVLLSAVAIAICYADRTNISVAVLKMAQEYDWDDELKGRIMSSFFYGYAVIQAPAGWIATRVGGMPTLLAAVLLWSLFTVVTPPACASLSLLFVTRVLMGMGEGLAFPSIHHLIAHYIVPAEQSSAIGVVTAASYIGTVVTNKATPAIIRRLSWEWSFYIFGSLGFLWCCVASVLNNHDVVKGMDGVCTLREMLRSVLGGGATSECQTVPAHARDHELQVVGDDEVEHDESPGPRDDEAPQQALARWLRLPWAQLLLRKQVWAIVINQFCSSWGFYVILNWIPTYYEEEFDIDAEDMGNLLVLPFLMQGLVGVCIGLIADYLITKQNINSVRLRAVLQISGMVLPAVLLLTLVLAHPTELWVANMLLTLALATNALTLAGVSAYQLDIAPKYAGFIFGLGNMAGSIAGIIGNETTGELLKVFESFDYVYLLAVGMFMIGAVSWAVLARGHTGPLPEFQ